MKFTKNTNTIIIVAVAVIWAFVTANIDRTLGIAYLLMVFFYGWMMKSGKVYPIIKSDFSFGREFSIILVASFFLIFIDSNIVKLYSVTGSVTMPTTLVTPFAGLEMTMGYTVYLFILLLAVPITEELFFRGALIPFFSSQFDNKYVVAGTSAGAFGLWHYMAYGGIISNMIVAGIFGLVAYFIVTKKGELIHVIFLHGIYNGFTEFKKRWVV